jgi:hypothetical protein
MDPDPDPGGPKTCGSDGSPYPDPDPQHWCPGADAGEAEDRDPRIVNAAGQRRNPISPSGNT